MLVRIVENSKPIISSMKICIKSQKQKKINILKNCNKEKYNQYIFKEAGKNVIKIKLRLAKVRKTNQL